MSMPELPLSPMAARVAGGDPIGIIFGKVHAASAANTDFISLAAGPPPNDLLPNDQLLGLIEEAQKNGGPGFMNYGRPAGSPGLCAVWAKELEEYNVPCESPMTEMLVTSGGNEAIALTMFALVSDGDTVLVEQPAFPGTLAAIKLAGGVAVHVDCDKEGMLPDALGAAIKKYGSKIVSLMPDFQNPSGKIMGVKRRKEIANVLKETGTFAVEDGVYAPLKFEGKPLPALRSFAPGNVFYISSVSKSLAPAERVGLLVGRADLVGTVANIKSVVNMQASNILQGVAAEFMRPEGPLRAHLKMLLPRYQERCRLMVESLAKYMPEANAVTPEGGMFLWVTAPDTVNFTEKLDDAIANGVAYVPGSMFYADPNIGHNQVRLNFASTSEDKIDEAIRRLAEVFKVKS